MLLTFATWLLVETTAGWYITFQFSECKISISRMRLLSLSLPLPIPSLISLSLHLLLYSIIKGLGVVFDLWMFLEVFCRRGLGRQMLKAAEDLAMTKGYQDMYLHCRIVDTAPLNMYKEAGYQVVATDSLLSVLTFQRRRYLMRKRLSRVKLVPE